MLQPNGIQDEKSEVLQPEGIRHDVWHTSLINNSFLNLGLKKKKQKASAIWKQLSFYPIHY